MRASIASLSFLASLLGLAACGDDSGAGGSTSSSAGTTSGQATGTAGPSQSSSTSSSPTTGASTGSGGSSGGYSLRFHGNGTGDIDRVKIPIDELPPDTSAGPPADIGGEDFTLELWMRATAAENPAGAVVCGDNLAWINGHVVFDRDRYNQDRKFGLSIAGGILVFGTSGDGTGDHTVCGTTDVLDDAWHHVAIARRRSDGRMWLFVDGNLEAEEDGPDGDISYPDDGVPGDFCGGPCDASDPFLVIAAEKHDAGPAYPSYAGYIDEVRLSRVLRYTGPFSPVADPFMTDGDTVALYHFDEGQGAVVNDTSGAQGGPSNGIIQSGGSPEGPQWSAETPL
jgi:hypothetical protein